MLIRPITETDYDQVLALENGVWTPQTSPVFDRVLTAEDLDLRRGNRSDILVAEDKGRILGTLPYNPMYPFEQGKHVGTFGLAVHPHYQGHGVGKALIQAFFDLAPSLGFTKVTIHVTGGNSSAIALYQKMGFQEEARCVGNLYIDGSYHDDLLFGKQLEDPHDK